MGFALEMTEITKRFPGTLAVSNVDFCVNSGEVHALMGENGAGKSTLMKVLAGSFDDYAGQIIINGKDVALHSPLMAMQEGIAMIYQELSLAKPLSVAENMLVGNLPVKNGLVDKKEMVRLCKQLLERVGLTDINPLTEISEISQHEAQLVEIAKALYRNPSILVMDEPTSALSREEVERLFDTIRLLKAQGMAIVYITHHLPEVFSIADRVTVLRDGKHVFTGDVADITPEKLVEHMVGQKLDIFYSKRAASVGDIVFRAENITRYGFFHDLSFEIRQGEILGLCGLAGSGRSEVARAIIGVDALDGGTIFFEGKKIKNRNMYEALVRGIAYLTEERKLTGLALRMTMEENALCALIPSLSKLGIYDGSKGKPILKDVVSRLQIYPPENNRMISNFSGGNQQKVLLGKWLALRPRLLILDEPTRGVDIGAKMLIHKVIQELAEEGNSILLISSDLPEMSGLSDRVIVLREGRLIGEIERDDISEERLLLAANGRGMAL
ncbi:MAG: sugar ABC transporter ATP-binding protein [Clostridia bacterium]|nr:sugar ABC transporter ATP-binding protein [Clostridia bacterium]